MIDDMDWKAAMNSEVFRGFIAAELQREAEEEAAKPTPEQIAKAQAEELDNVLIAMDEFESELKKSPQLKATFKRAKQALLSNPELMEKTEPSFVRGIMMLDLEDEE